MDKMKDLNITWTIQGLMDKVKDLNITWTIQGLMDKVKDLNMDEEQMMKDIQKGRFTLRYCLTCPSSSPPPILSETFHERVKAARTRSAFAPKWHYKNGFVEVLPTRTFFSSELSFATGTC